ncbi:DNase I-like protein, partial [Trametes cingulata]
RNGGRGLNKPPATRARFKLASLNIIGFRLNDGSDDSNKWLLVNQMMRDSRIGVLAVQEAHLDEKRADDIRSLFGQRLDLLFSADPSNPLGARGVAFVVNKKVLQASDLSLKEIVPGRAALLELTWSTNRRLKILNVYGPNDRQESAIFWRAIKSAGLTNISFMLGDLNVVEFPMDRLPRKDDASQAQEALHDLTLSLRVVDGWRRENPDTCAYTYLQQATGSQSRIDRIYVARNMSKDTDDWEIRESGIPTDHKMVSVMVANKKAPFVGRGRWSMPTHLLNDDAMKVEMKRLGARLIMGIAGIGERSVACNAQELYNEFKEDLIKAARSRAKAKIPKIERQINRLREDLHALLNPTAERNPAEEEAVIRSAAIIQDRIDNLEQKRFGRKRASVAAKHWMHGETISKYWIRNN